MAAAHSWESDFVLVSHAATDPLLERCFQYIGWFPMSSAVRALNQVQLEERLVAKSKQLQEVRLFWRQESWKRTNRTRRRLGEVGICET